jgi:uncharacterized membrane protein
VKPPTDASVLEHPHAHSPVVVEHARRHAEDVQLHIADVITRFAGSMPFVYIHAVGFAAWMLFVESSPWPTLTLIVSLEAIFPSTFVMIGQNRQAAFQQSKADHEFQTEEQELHENTELTREIHRLTLELHAIQVQLAGRAGASPAAPATAGRHSHHAADPPPPGNPST